MSQLLRQLEIRAVTNLAELEDDRIRHVYPTFGREHVTDQLDRCWCQPRVEFVDGGAIIIHEAEQ